MAPHREPATAARHLALPSGEREFLLGVNYWARHAGPHMWDDDRWNAELVARELDHVASTGLNALRCFLFAPTAFASAGRIDERVMNRFRGFLELAAERRLAVLPTAIVGHMSGENFPLPGQAERSPYTEPEVLEWQEALVAAMARAAADHPPLAWVLSNEMPLFAGATDVVTASAWSARLAGAFRAADRHGRPVGTGDGLMGLGGATNGFDPQWLVGLVDYLGPHLYHADTDPYRQAAYTSYVLRSLLWLGKPVLLEEFGASATQASEQNQALYVRETLFTALALGAAGGLVWCWSDFAGEVARQPPYVDHAFEVGFGVTSADGVEKPACAELRALRGLVTRDLDLSALTFPPPKACLLTPRQLAERVSFSVDDRRTMVRTVVQAMVLASRAGLEVDVIPETAFARGLAEAAHYQLFLLPSTQKLATTTWDWLVERIARGAVLYWSWFGGDQDFHQNAWCHRFNELTGCRHRLRYGCPDLAEATERLLLRSGECLQASPPAGTTAWARAFLPIDCGPGVEILGARGAGEPAFLRWRLGAGQVLFVAMPWERWLADAHGINETTNAHILYRVVAAAAGLAPRYQVPDPRIEAHVVLDGADDLVFLQNRSYAPVMAPAALGGAQLIWSTARDGECFAPKEARVYRVRGVRE